MSLAATTNVSSVTTPITQLDGVGFEIKHSQPSLSALTSLRFFAAIYVVIFHTAAGHDLFGPVIVENFVAAGNTGVSLFFILSGFILAYNYREDLDRRSFWISRFARIYPVYALALVLSLAFLFAPATQRPSHILPRIVLSSTLLQTWYRPFENSFNGPGWTLSVEAFFYALFPFVLAPVRRTGGWAFASLCLLYVGAMSVPWAAHLAFPASPRPFEAATYLTLGTLPLLHLPLFLIGIYLGARYRRRGGGSGLWPLAFGTIGSFVLLSLGPTGVFVPIRKGMLVLAYAALTYSLASIRRGFLTNRWMVLAGEISFSIYILQMPVMRAVFAVTRRVQLESHLSIALTLLVLCGVSYLTYRFVELPARLAIRERFTHCVVPLERL